MKKNTILLLIFLSLYSCSSKLYKDYKNPVESIELRSDKNIFYFRHIREWSPNTSFGTYKVNGDTLVFASTPNADKASIQIEFRKQKGREKKSIVYFSGAFDTSGFESIYLEKENGEFVKNVKSCFNTDLETNLYIANPYRLHFIISPKRLMYAKEIISIPFALKDSTSNYVTALIPIYHYSFIPFNRKAIIKRTSIYFVDDKKHVLYKSHPWDQDYLPNPPDSIVYGHGEVNLKK